MRITALVRDPDHVCCRYRLAAFGPDLARAGHMLELRPYPRGWLSPLRLCRELRHANGVILQRRLLPFWQLVLLRRTAKWLLFDFDDAIFLRDSYAPRGSDSRVRSRRFAAVMRAADAVVAGNSFLCQQACRWAPVDRVTVVPTCIEPARYRLADHTHAGNKIQLAWIGSSSTLRGLERIRTILEGLGQRWPGMSLKLICDDFLRLECLRVVGRRWSDETEAAELAGADVGIAWMPDDPWSQGKCGLKVLQYMAAGLPVVANPVGVHCDLIHDRESGFLVSTAQEWAEAVGRLAHDPDLRRRMGGAGRRRVEAAFDVRRGATHWIALLDRLAAGDDGSPEAAARRPTAVHE